jgi:hypothetical protein
MRPIAIALLTMALPVAATPCTPSEAALEAFLATASKPTADNPGFASADSLREAIRLLESVTGTLPSTSDVLAKAQGSLEANLDADMSHLLDVERCPMALLFVVASRAIETHRRKGVTEADRNRLRGALRRWIQSASDRRLETLDLMGRLAVIEKMHRSGLDPLPAPARQPFERLRSDAEDARRASVMSAEEWKRSPGRTAYRALDAKTRRKLNAKWLEELRSEDALRQRLAALAEAYPSGKRRGE